MKTFRYVEDVSKDFQGEALLFYLSDLGYVVLSSITYAFDTGCAECLAFPANAKGKITDWFELTWSQRETTDHYKVLADAGYVEEK